MQRNSFEHFATVQATRIITHPPPTHTTPTTTAALATAQTSGVFLRHCLDGTGNVCVRRCVLLVVLGRPFRFAQLRQRFSRAYVGEYAIRRCV